MHILVVEDDARIAGFVTKGLEESGYNTTVARDGEEGFLDARYNDYDLIVLDLMLPKMDGIEVARKLRAAGKATPMLMLTARDTERDKIRGLDVGADDYLTKPFGLRELLARVHAMLRRAEMLQPQPSSASAPTPAAGRTSPFPRKGATSRPRLRASR